MSLRIAFFGTGNLAGPAFHALLESQHQVVGLITQPDRTGRGHHQHVNPLKEAACSRGIPVLQPDSIKAAEAIAGLASLNADLFVVAAYGQMLSPDVLAVPPKGTINIHASLLPKYRGATPIHAAILNGDVETGVTIIEIEPKMDAGPMLGVVRTPINSEETTGQLEKRLAEMAVPLVMKVIEDIESGTVVRVVQDPTQVVRVRKLSKQDGRIDWSASAEQVARHVRGMQPWPGPFTELHQPGKPPLRIQILSVESIPGCARENENCEPGQPDTAFGKELVVCCSSGRVRVHTLQPDGKRPMSADEFLRGRLLSSQDRFR